MNNVKRICRRLWPAAILLITLFIWSRSLQDRSASSQESDAVKGWLLWLFGEGIADSFLYAYIRKVAHFAEFALLGCAWAGWQQTLRPAGWHRLPFWFAGPVTAIIDELLQLFSDSRAPMMRDVLLDCAGYLAGMAGLWLVCRLWRWLTQKRKGETP